MTLDTILIFAFVAAYFSLAFVLMKYSLAAGVVSEKKLAPIPIRSRRPRG